MKYLILTFTLLMLFLGNAQTLKVTYTEKIDLTEKLKSIDNPMIKQMIIEKTKQPKHYELLSSNGISIYQKQNVAEKDIDNDVTIEMDGQNDIIYKNHTNKTYVKQTDFMSRTFLIEDKLPKYNWVITDDTLKIGAYQCKKATLKKGNITAWFTNEIPSNEGPRAFYGLPGLILKIKMGPIIIEAVNVAITKDKVSIQKPTKGKKVTQEKFDKIKKEKTNSLTGGKQQDNGVQIIKM